MNEFDVTDELPAEDTEVPAYAEPGAELKPGQTRVQVIDLTDKVKDRKTLKNSHAFHFEYHSKLDKRVFAGNITIKRLNLGELARVETEIARRNAGLQPGDGIAVFNERMLLVVSRVVEGPEWAKQIDTSDDVHDPLLVQRLWEEVQKFEDSFR